MDRLSQCKFTTVQLGDALDLSSLRSSGGDFVLGQLANVVDTEAVTAMAISAWRSKAGKRPILPSLSHHDAFSDIKGTMI